MVVVARSAIVFIFIFEAGSLYSESWRMGKRVTSTYFPQKPNKTWRQLRFAPCHHFDVSHQMKPLCLLTLFLAGCGLVPQKVSVTDPEVQSLFSQSRIFPRENYGFSPLPTDNKTDIRIQRHSRGAYDVMLHIYSGTSRTIAFRRTENGYRWIHEQESFQGPKTYNSPDGHLREQIVLTYETEPVSGGNNNALTINYFGEDKRLSGHRNISLSEIKPILDEWGYKDNG